MDQMTQSAQISSSQGLADGQNSAAQESTQSGKKRCTKSIVHDTFILYALSYVCLLMSRNNKDRLTALREVNLDLQCKPVTKTQVSFIWRTHVLTWFQL